MAGKSCSQFIAALVLLALAGGWARGQEPSGIEAVTAIERTLINAIAGAEKSVVAIARVRKERPDETSTTEFRPDPFGRRIVASSVPQPTDPAFIPNEFATGVVVDRRGLILTVCHVLGEDSEYYVTTIDRKVYRARLKGADPRSDLAVLAIDATDLTPSKLGNSVTLRKGQIVIALGNPYAIARDGQVSAAWGIVANLARKAPAAEESDSTGKSTLHHFGTLIQTAAKLNLGTSGGPLLNLKGEMVGLVTSLAAAAGYQRAAGYAIPVDETFRRVVDILKQGREVEYGFLGIQPTNLTSQEVLSGLRGMRVHRVVRGTPAARSGLKDDDIITAVNDRPIFDADGLVLEVGRLPVDATARLSILRGKKEIALPVTLTKFPVRGRKIVTQRAPAWRGMRIDYPTAAVDLNRRIYDGFDEGVIVTDVEEGTPAWQARLRPGQLISHVDRTAVKTPKQFRAAIDGKVGPVRLRVVDRDSETVRTVAPQS